MLCEAEFIQMFDSFVPAGFDFLHSVRAISA